MAEITPSPEKPLITKKMTSADINFVHIQPDNGLLHLKPSQLTTIAESLPFSQCLIHYAFWSDIRYNKRVTPKCLSILTGNMVTIFKYEKIKISEEDKKSTVYPLNAIPESDQIVQMTQFILKDLEFIAYSKDQEVLLKTSTDNVRYLNENNGINVKFAQLVYRNYSINFAAYKGVEFVELRSVDMSLFPDLEFYMSPSQRFQFLYYALCVEYKAIYYQEVVRFVHSLVLAGISIIDISKLPFDLFGQYEKGYDLRPIFQALSMMNFVCGICCSNTNQPDLMESIGFLLNSTSKIKMLHLVNCGINSGLKKFASSMSKKSGLNVRYWNLRGNQFSDIESIVDIIQNTQAPLLFLDLSETGMKSETAIDLFNVLKKYPTLQQLYLAGVETSSELFIAFDEYLTSISSNPEINLHALDLSKTVNVGGFLRVLNSHNNIPIISLKIADLEIDQDAANELKIFISKSKTLRELDLSGTKINAESVADVISSISKNNKLHHFRLAINSLDLKTGNLLPIFRVFLDGNLYRWNSLSLNSNHMTEDDLHNITPLLKMMKKLRYLSLNDNFNSDMKNIDTYLVELANIPNLQHLSVTGSKENRLKGKIIPLLKAIRTHKNITTIDFSDNEGGDDFYSSIIHFLRAENSIQTLKIDGNKPTSIDYFSELAKEIPNTSIISFDFPLNDSSYILKKFQDSELKNAISRVSSIQLSILDAVNKNRAKQYLLADLPFETTHEIRKLVFEMTEEMRLQFVANEKPLLHSLLCEEFGLPLPFQDRGDLAIDGGKLGIVNQINKRYKCYLSSRLGRVVEEDPSHLLIPDPEKVKLPNTSSSSELEQESSSCEDENPTPKATTTNNTSLSTTTNTKNGDETSEATENGKKKSKKTKRQSGSESSGDENPKKKSNKINRTKSSDDDDSETNKKRSRKSKVQSNSSEDGTPKKKSHRSKRKSLNRSSDDSDSENPKKRSKRIKPIDSSTSSDDENLRKKSNRSKRKSLNRSSDDSDNENQKKKSKRIKPLDNSSSSDDENVRKKFQKSKRQLIGSSEEEIFQLKLKSKKNVDDDQENQRKKSSKKKRYNDNDDESSDGLNEKNRSSKSKSKIQSKKYSLEKIDNSDLSTSSTKNRKSNRKSLEKRSVKTFDSSEDSENEKKRSKKQKLNIDSDEEFGKLKKLNRKSSNNKLLKSSDEEEENRKNKKTNSKKILKKFDDDSSSSNEFANPRKSKKKNASYRNKRTNLQNDDSNTGSDGEEKATVKRRSARKSLDININIKNKKKSNKLDSNSDSNSDSADFFNRKKNKQEQKQTNRKRISLFSSSDDSDKNDIPKGNRNSQKKDESSSSSSSDERPIRRTPPPDEAKSQRKSLSLRIKSSSSSESENEEDIYKRGMKLNKNNKGKQSEPPVLPLSTASSVSEPFKKGGKQQILKKISLPKNDDVHFTFSSDDEDENETKGKARKHSSDESDSDGVYNKRQKNKLHKNKNSEDDDNETNLVNKRAEDEVDKLVDISYKPDKAAISKKASKVVRRPPPKLKPKAEQNPKRH
ncbi:hypothetical protein TRFO_15235 [Tritrichomonas foetus]|uniref:Leucine Rich Repeat family protein n=1 Tax=Tritrichomonas foetus TaxID=1144522 RepID=A0A1J4KU55_9EUKA|nr:hypothetical protein TRFO_15235 [Tritrichomonas foetus]|eukprot:OHT14440.1 hypothetical protein TRFO_15235 [Tritrichomonas foetus]